MGLPATKNFPSGVSIPVIDSFSNSAISEFLKSNQPRSQRGWFDNDLPNFQLARGIYIGTEGFFDLWILEDNGDFENPGGVVKPFLGIAGGIIHPMFPRQVLSSVTDLRGNVHKTTAVNIEIKY